MANDLTLGRALGAVLAEDDDDSALSEFDRLRDALAEQRRRGIGFGEAWESARHSLDLPDEIVATGDSWERAYERRPPEARELAVVALQAALADGLSEDTETLDMLDPRCYGAGTG